MKHRLTLTAGSLIIIFSFQNCGPGFTTAKSIVAGNSLSNEGTTPTNSRFQLASPKINPGEDADVTITLVAPKAVDSTFDFQTQDDSATAGRHYVFSKGAVTIAKGEIKAHFKIQTNSNPGLTYVSQQFFVTATARESKQSEIVAIVFGSGLKQTSLTGTWRSINSQLSAGNQAAGIWTGKRLLTWDGSAILSYDPITNQIEKRGLSNKPPPLSAYAAVWTGSKMLIWGGYSLGPNGFQTLNAGWLYDPEVDGWSQISSTGAPTPSAFVAATWTGTEMFVWGGFSLPDQGSSGDPKMYNPASDTWRTVNSLGTPPPNRISASAVWNGSDVIVWGGNDSGTARSEGALFDPLTGEWKALDQGELRPPARGGHAAVWTGTQMLIWGGSVSDGSGQNTDSNGNSFLSDAWAFNPQLNVWIQLPASPLAARYRPAAAWTGSEMLILGGSLNGSSAPNDGAAFR